VTEEQKISNVELTILMPCLNEAETVGTCVSKACTPARRLVSGRERLSLRGLPDGLCRSAAWHAVG
jgi:hypothetical protein